MRAVLDATLIQMAFSSMFLDQKRGHYLVRELPPYRVTISLPKADIPMTSDAIEWPLC